MDNQYLTVGLSELIVIRQRVISAVKMQDILTGNGEKQWRSA